MFQQQQQQQPRIRMSSTGSGAASATTAMPQISPSSGVAPPDSPTSVGDVRFGNVSGGDGDGVGASRVNNNSSGSNINDGSDETLPPMNFDMDRFPYCIVWTPIPVLTWFFPMIGHMGICMSNGVIRDFAGPYFVSEDNMGFGRPTRYLPLHPRHVNGGRYEWDEAVSKASVLYGTRMHNLFCDNCHSHVATALIAMRYRQCTSWNMIVLAFWMFFCGRFVGVSGIVKSFLPFLIVVTICVILGIYL